MKNLIFTFVLSLAFILNAQTWSLINTDNSNICSDAILSMYNDEYGNLWMGTYDKGFIVYDGETFTCYNSTTNDDFDADIVNDIIGDTGQNYWITTDYKGVYKKYVGIWTHYSPADMGFDLGPYESLIVRTVAIQNGGPNFVKGAVWFGTYQRGLVKFDGTNWTHYTAEDGILPDDGVHALAIESDPSVDTSYVVWVGTGQGLMKFDGHNWERISILGDSTKWINTIAFENGGTQFSDGKMYVGTESGEFCIYDGNSWDIYNLADAWNPNNAVTDIKVDNSGRKWIGTEATGLWMYDETQFIGYYKDNSPIPGNDVLSIEVKNLPDSNQVWMSIYDNDSHTYKGITILTVPSVNGINEENENVTKFSLSQNYPNPFNPTTTIQYSIPDGKTLHSTSPTVQLIVYDILGRQIATLVNKKQSPGNYKVKFDASKLNSGVYFYTLRAGNFVATKKMILMK